jgi:hypothetical protein
MSYVSILELQILEYQQYPAWRTQSDPTPRSLYRAARYTGQFVIQDTSLYRRVRYTGQFVIQDSSLYRAVRYTEQFVIQSSSLYRAVRYTGQFVIRITGSYNIARYERGAVFRRVPGAHGQPKTECFALVSRRAHTSRRQRTRMPENKSETSQQRRPGQFIPAHTDGRKQKTRNKNVSPLFSMTVCVAWKTKNAKQKRFAVVFDVRVRCLKTENAKHVFCFQTCQINKTVLPKSKFYSIHLWL